MTDIQEPKDNPEQNPEQPATATAAPAPAPEPATPPEVTAVAAPAAPPPAAPPPARSGRGLAVAALLLALGAAGASGYLWYLWDYRLKDTIDQAVSRRDAEFQALQAQARKLADTTSGLQTGHENHEQQVGSLRESLGTVHDAIKNLQGNITTLKGEVEIHKGGTEIQKADTQNLIAHVRTLQADIQNIQGALQELGNSNRTLQTDGQTFKSNIHALQQDTQSLAGNLDTLKTQLEGATAERKRAVADLDNKILNLQTGQRNLLTTLDNVKNVAAHGGDINALALSEVEFLLRMAAHKLQFQSDIAGAQQALTLANQRLKQVNESAFSGVQQMIEENIANLRGLDQVDLDNVADRLIALESKLDQLPLHSQQELAQLKDRVKPHDIDLAVTEPTWWQHFLSLAGQQLKDIIVIRRERNDQAPLLAVEEEYFLRQNLRMELEAMRLALLNRDFSSYLKSDDIARQWVTTYFDTNNADVKDFAAKLETLKTVNLAPQLPDLTATLTAFRDAMERRQPVRSVVAPAAAGTEGAQ